MNPQLLYRSFSTGPLRLSSIEKESTCSAPQEDTSTSTSTSTSARSNSVDSGPRNQRKRPYIKAHAKEAPDGSGQYAVYLDNRELLTPAKQPVRVPSLALAYALAAEWEWQEGVKLRPYTMPLMKLVATSMDQIPHDRPKVIQSLTQFFHTDLILIRHPEPDDDPAGSQVSDSGWGGWGAFELEGIKGASFSNYQKLLYEKQQELWEPLLHELKSELGIEAVPCYDCMPPPQSNAAIVTLREFLEGLDDWNLTAVDFLASATRSVSIALLLSQGVIDVDTATKAARLEEDFQIASAGFVEGGHDIDLADIRVKLLAPIVFLKLLNLRNS